MKRLLIVLLLIVAGCGGHKPLYGTIVRKMFHPAWTEIRTTTVGKSIQVETVHHPPRWEFVIQKEDTTGDECQQLIVTSESEYVRLDVGRIWYRKDTVIEQ